MYKTVSTLPFVPYKMSQVFNNVEYTSVHFDQSVIIISFLGVSGCTAIYLS